VKSILGDTTTCLANRIALFTKSWVCVCCEGGMLRADHISGSLAFLWGVLWRMLEICIDTDSYHFGRIGRRAGSFC
jgi:hypothetical protein